MTPIWYQFGQALGMENEVLDIYTQFSADVSIVEMLDFWLRNRHTKPTWEDVAKALREIKLQQLAEKIDALCV